MNEIVFQRNIHNLHNKDKNVHQQYTSFYPENFSDGKKNDNFLFGNHSQTSAIAASKVDL